MSFKYIGDYQIIRELGQGGMATVYLGVHREVPNLKVVLKVLQHPRMAMRFRQEADKLALLERNRHVCQLRHFFTHDDRTIIIMEYIDGPTLEQVVETRGPLSVGEAARIVGTVLDTLSRAHSLGIWHRDIKPSNIMLEHGSPSAVKLIDFGIAKAKTDPSITVTGGSCGTPLFMAPEQFTPSDTTDFALADIYATGMTLFYLLTGRLPYEGDNEYAIRDAKLSEDPPSPRVYNASLSRNMEAVVLKAIERSPQRRHQSARDMKLELEFAAGGGRKARELPGQRRSRRTGWLVAIMALLVLVGSITLYPHAAKLAKEWISGTAADAVPGSGSRTGHQEVIQAGMPGASPTPADQSKWDAIVNDPAYLWGTGTGATPEQARQAAQADLLSKIQIAIAVNFDSRMIERQSNESFDLSDSTVLEVSTYTFQRLTGLDHLIVESTNGYRVLAFISRKDYARSLDHRKQEIRDLIGLAQSAEQQRRIGDALKNLYWAWLLCKTCPDTMAVQIGDLLSTTPGPALWEKLCHTVSSISATERQVYRDGDVILADVSFEYHGRPIVNLSYSYYSGLATDYGTVHNGSSTLPLYDNPVNPTRELPLSIDFAAEAEMISNKELYRLHELVGARQLPNTVPVKLAFGWLRKSKEPVTPPRPRVVVEGPIVPDDNRFPVAIVALGNQDHTQDFLRLLEQYRTLDSLDYGDKPLSDNAVRNFVALVDSTRVFAIYEFDGTRYLSISGDHSIHDLKEHTGRIQIWIHTSKPND